MAAEEASMPLQAVAPGVSSSDQSPSSHSLSAILMNPSHGENHLASSSPSSFHAAHGGGHSSVVSQRATYSFPVVHPLEILGKNPWRVAFPFIPLLN